MTLRTGMTELVAEVRRKTDTTDDDVTIGGVTYWTDDQLQAIIDQHGMDMLDLRLLPYPLAVDNVTTWTKYYIPSQYGLWWESDFQVVTSTGALVPSTDYTYSRYKNLVEFDTDTAGVMYFLRGTVYDLNLAIAQVWQEKADMRTRLVDWRAGQHAVKEDQEYQHCVERVKFYRGKRLFSVKMIQTGYNNVL
jgi:hypothetical protein